MKRLIPLALVLLFVAACAAQAEPMKLAYKFTKNEVDKYKLSMNMTVNMPGLPDGKPLDMKMEMTLRQRTLEVYPDGSARVRASYAVDRVTGPGMDNAKSKVPQQSTVVMTMAPDGRVSNVEGLEKLMGASGIPGMDMSQFGNMMGMNAMFPENPVDTGYTWNQTIPIPFLGTDATVKSSVLSVGEKIWSIPTVKICQDFAMTGDMAKMMQSVMGSSSSGGAVPAGLTGNMAMNGKMEFDFAHSIGKILKGKGDIAGTFNLHIPGSSGSTGMDMAMQMNMRISMSRFK